MVDRFVPGTFVQRREVHQGRVWLSAPVRVVADDDVLAVWLAEGTPLTFPDHPLGRHPWSGRSRWTGTSVLQVHRPGDAHAVWALFRDGRVDHWYVNFQDPYRRSADGFDTQDHGLDIVIRDDGWHWKDRGDVAMLVATGRLTRAQADAVWAEAGFVASALDRGECWWRARWGGWTLDPDWTHP